MKISSCILSIVTFLTPRILAEYIIGNGDEASVGQFPYQALIMAIFPNDKTGICGGSLISDEWVLTASHCLQTESGEHVTDIIVNLGITVSNTISMETGSLVLYSSEFILHPMSFGNGAINNSNDLGLIRLPEKVELSHTVQPIRLVKSDVGDLVSAKAIVSGWGETATNSSALAETLMYTIVRIISNEECIETYGSEVITDGVVCAKSDFKSGTCAGDSGGPLAIFEAEERVLAGIVGFGESRFSCQSGYPRGFNRISAHREWIRDVAKV